MGRLQYIYNTATNARFYNNFNITVDNNSEVEMQFRVLNPNDFWDGRLFLIGEAYHDCYAQFQGHNVIRCGFQSFAELTTTLQDPSAIHTVNVSANGYFVDGVSLGTLSGSASVRGNGFTINETNNMLLEIYYITIKDSGVLTHNYLPWDNNGVVGLMDVIEDTFYAPTTGVFYGQPLPTPSIQVPINKYKLGANNITKTYEGGTKINKIYVGNDLVYRALPTTTGPQLQMPLNEVWYKTTNNNSMGLRSGSYYIDENGNQLTYTESFDSVSGLWKMVFSDDVYGCQGPVYYNNDDRLVEVWYPYGYVKPNGMFAYGQTHLEKFKGDSPAIVDNGNAILCLVDCDVDGVNGKNFAMQAVTSGATTINIPEGALGVGSYAFYKATAITINLPSTITYVGNYCFERTNLTALNCYATTVPTTFSNIWWAVGNSGTLHYPTGSDYSSFPVPSRWTKVGDL